MSDEKRIIVAEDDVQLAGSIKTLLEGAGHEVSQPEKGMVFAREPTLDLILSDILLAGQPGPTGIEISQRHRRNPILKDTPVSLLTGVRKHLGMRLRMEPDETFMPLSDILDKPFWTRRLLSVIESVFGSVA